MIGLCVVVDRKSCNLGEDPKNEQSVPWLAKFMKAMLGLLVLTITPRPIYDYNGL